MNAFLDSLKVGDTVALEDRALPWDLFRRHTSWRIYKMEKISQKRHTFALRCEAEDLSIVLTKYYFKRINPVTQEILDEIGRVDKACTAFACMSALESASRQGLKWALVTSEQAEKMKALLDGLLAVFEEVNSAAGAR